jgi:Mg2+ and Co2+ transporter CorA
MMTMTQSPMLPRRFSLSPRSSLFLFGFTYALTSLFLFFSDTSAKAKAEEEEQTAYEAMMERVKEAEARLARLRRNMAKVYKTTKNLNKRVRVDRKRQKYSKRRKITHSGDTDGYRGVSQLSVTSQTRENDEESQKITAEIRRLVKELEALTEETSSMMHDSGVRVVKE